MAFLNYACAFSLERDHGDLEDVMAELKVPSELIANNVLNLIWLINLVHRVQASSKIIGDCRFK